MDIFRRTDNRQGQGKVLNDLGDLALRLGQHAEAETCFEQALHISHEIGYQWGEALSQANLGRLSHHQGDNLAAREYGQQALRIAQALGDRSMQAYVLTTLGHALMGLGQLAEAAAAYQQAFTLRQALDEQGLALEALAGLAGVSLARGDGMSTLRQVENILVHLASNELDGAVDPWRVYLICYRGLCSHQDPRARDLLAIAHRRLQEHAARLEDLDLRRSFLENVPTHREIVQAWQAGDGWEHLRQWPVLSTGWGDLTIPLTR